jgi:hypothetical protein
MKDLLEARSLIKAYKTLVADNRRVIKSLDQRLLENKMNVLEVIFNLLKAVLNLVEKVSTDTGDLNDIKVDLQRLVGRVEAKKNSGSTLG